MEDQNLATLKASQCSQAGIFANWAPWWCMIRHVSSLEWHHISSLVMWICNQGWKEALSSHCSFPASSPCQTSQPPIPEYPNIPIPQLLQSQNAFSFISYFLWFVRVWASLMEPDCLWSLENRSRIPERPVESVWMCSLSNLHDLTLLGWNRKSTKWYSFMVYKQYHTVVMAILFWHSDECMFWGVFCYFLFCTCPCNLYHSDWKIMVHA